MTIAFKWYSWYLFGYCRLREDYRLFRLTRINNLKLLDEKYVRREIEFNDYEKLGKDNYDKYSQKVILKFSKSINAFANDYFREFDITYDEEGNAIVKMKIPVDEWFYGMILSYGENVEVLEPRNIREKIISKAEKIKSIYQSP